MPRPRKIKKANGYKKAKLQLYIHPAAFGKLLLLAKQKAYVGRDRKTPKPARLLTAWIEKELGVPKMTRKQLEAFIEVAEEFLDDD